MDSSSPFSRKSALQPVFGRGGMNFDGSYHGVEMVTSTTTQFQHTTTSVIRSNNLNEVHNIINRVDSAYKLRKKECQRLQWKISDLESQLEDIQRQTREYTEISAIQNAALSWNRNNFDKVVADFEETQAAHAGAYQQAQAAMNDAINQVLACACIYGREFDTLRKDKEVIEKLARQTCMRISQVAEEYDSLFCKLGSVQANINDAVEIMKEMRKVNFSLDQEYESSRAEISLSEAAYAKILKEQSDAEDEYARRKEHLTALLREHEDLDHLSLDVKHKTETKIKALQLRNAEVEQMKVDCAEQQMTIGKETSATLNSSDEIKAATGNQAIDFFKLSSHLAKELQANKTQVLNIVKEVERETAVAANLEADISTQQHQFECLKSSIFNIQQANKMTFEATCMKMKELKSLHEVISRVQNECQKTELLIQEQQTLLEAALRREILEEENAEAELKQLQDQVVHQRMVTQVAKDRNEMSKQELSSAIVERTEKEATITQLEELANEMENALLEVTQKQNESNKLQTAIHSAIGEREVQTMRCEDLDSEITKLNIQADELQSSSHTGDLKPLFSEQELVDIEAEVHIEYAKLCNTIDMKQQREVDEIESYREQIRRSNSSSLKATKLKAEITELEALIAEVNAKLEKGENFSPKILTRKENVKNIAHGRKLGDANNSLTSLWDFKPAAARTEKADSSGLFSFKRRKTTLSSRMSDMDASMEDLFADDI